MPETKQTITDLIGRPEFQRLPKARQEALIVEWTMGANQPDADSMSELPQSAASKFIQQDIAGKPLSKRLEGAAIGVGTGAMFGGGPMGGLFGAGFGAIAPPETPGDYTTQILGGPLAKGAGKMVNKIPPGFLKTLASGGAGAGITELLHGAGEATNRMFGSPKGDFMTTDPVSLGLGAIPPALGTALLTNKVQKNPTVKTNDFVNEQLGTKSPLSQVSNIGDRPTDPRLGGVMAAAEDPAMMQNVADIRTARQQLQASNLGQKQKDVSIALLKSQIAGRDVQRKKTIADKIRSFAGLTIDPADISKSDEMRVEQILQQESDLVKKRATYKEAGLLGADKDTKVDLLSEITGAELGLLQKRAEIVQEKAIEKAAKAATGSAPDPTKLQLANIDTSKAVARKAITQQMGEKKKIATGQEYLKQSIANLKEQAGVMQEAMNPILRKIAWDNPDPAKLIEGFMKDGTPEAIKAFKSHLQSQPNGAAHLSAFQDGMLQEFFKRAFDPQTKTLSNAQALFAPDGPFSAQKIEALYGPDKVTTFRQVFDDIQKITADSKKPWNVLAHTLPHALFWALPTAIMHNRVSVGHAAVGVAAGAGLSAIAWPKFVNSMLKNPKYADRFHQWATSDVTQRNLKNWPTLAQFFDENSEPVNDVINTPN